MIIERGPVFTHLNAQPVYEWVVDDDTGERSVFVGFYGEEFGIDRLDQLTEDRFVIAPGAIYQPATIPLN